MSRKHFFYPPPYLKEGNRESYIVGIYLPGLRRTESRRQKSRIPLKSPGRSCPTHLRTESRRHHLIDLFETLEMRRSKGLELHWEQSHGRQRVFFSRNNSKNKARAYLGRRLRRSAVISTPTPPRKRLREISNKIRTPQLLSHCWSGRHGRQK